MEKEGQGAAHVGYAAGTGSYLGPSFKQAQQAEVVEASKRWSQRSDPAEVKRQMKELLVVEESEHGPGGWDAWGALEREENHERELGGRGLTREEQRILEGEATSSSVDEDIWKPETERGEQALQVNGENPVSLDTKESQEFAQENQVDYDSGGESDDGVHYEVDNETDEDAEARWAREAVDARLKDDPAILAALSRVALGPNVPTAEIVEDSEFGEDPTPSQRVLVEMQEENLFAEGHGLELRAVMSDESWGSSSVDFNKAPDDSETSSSHADLRRWDAIDSPGQTRDLRGFSMAAGLPPAPALGAPRAPGESEPYSTPLGATARLQKPRPLRGVRESDLVPGGKLFEEARRLHGRLHRGVAYRFPRRPGITGRIFRFVSDAGGDRLVDITSNVPRPVRNQTAVSASRTKSEAELRAEAAGFPAGWQLDEAGGVGSDGVARYRRWVHWDGQEFYDEPAARVYAQLLAKQRVEYRFQRLTQLGDPSATHATIELGDCMPVSSCMASLYEGQIAEAEAMGAPRAEAPAGGPLEGSRDDRELRTVLQPTDYFQGTAVAKRATAEAEASQAAELALSALRACKGDEWVEKAFWRAEEKIRGDGAAGTIAVAARDVGWQGSPGRVVAHTIAESLQSEGLLDHEVLCAAASFGLPEMEPAEAKDVGSAEETGKSTLFGEKEEPPAGEEEAWEQLADGGPRGRVASARAALWWALAGATPRAKVERWGARVRARRMHHRLVQVACLEVDFEPFELFDEYPEQAQRAEEGGDGFERLLCGWDTGMETHEGGNGDVDWRVVERVGDAMHEDSDSVPMGYGPGTDGRWERVWANPGLELKADGRVAPREEKRHAEKCASERWRDFFAAREMWDEIDYDTWNGTYPQRAQLLAQERPRSRMRLHELQEKERIGTLTQREGRELWWAQELHYDAIFGVYPGTGGLPRDLAHLITRVLYTYLRVHPAVVYAPDMHHILAPIVWVLARDPKQGLRQGLLDREKSVAYAGLDPLEADAFVLFHLVSSQFFLHFGEVLPGAGVDAAALVALETEAILEAADPELAARLFGAVQAGGLGLSAETFVRPWISSLFSGLFPLWELLPLIEAVLAAPDRLRALAALCAAIAAAPASRAPLFFASCDETLLLLQFPPATRADPLLLAAHRLSGAAPASLRLRAPPALETAARARGFIDAGEAAAALGNRNASIRRARAEVRELVAWAEQAEPLSANGGVAVTHIPFVHADGTTGFRALDGQGFGFGADPSQNQSRYATRFTEPTHVACLSHPPFPPACLLVKLCCLCPWSSLFLSATLSPFNQKLPQVVPRLRYLGADPAAPLNFTSLLAPLPPVPHVSSAAPLRQQLVQPREDVPTREADLPERHQYLSTGILATHRGIPVAEEAAGDSFDLFSYSSLAAPSHATVAPSARHGKLAEQVAVAKSMRIGESVATPVSFVAGKPDIKRAVGSGKLFTSASHAPRVTAPITNCATAGEEGDVVHGGAAEATQQDGAARANVGWLGEGVLPDISSDDANDESMGALVTVQGVPDVRSKNGGEESEEGWWGTATPRVEDGVEELQRLRQEEDLQIEMEPDIFPRYRYMPPVDGPHDVEAAVLRTQIQVDEHIRMEEEFLLSQERAERRG